MWLGDLIIKGHGSSCVYTLRVCVDFVGAADHALLIHQPDGAIVVRCFSTCFPAMLINFFRIDECFRESNQTKPSAFDSAQHCWSVETHEGVLLLHNMHLITSHGQAWIVIQPHRRPRPVTHSHNDITHVWFSTNLRVTAHVHFCVCL